MKNLTATKKKSVALLGLTGSAIVLLALAGCTATGSASADTAKKDSGKASSEETFVPEKKDFECVDGVATAEESNAILTLTGDCASVEVTGVNSLITITGSVESLTVGGSINKVVAAGVTAVTFPEDSSGNIVETASTPEVTENGAENEVVAPEATDAPEATEAPETAEDEAPAAE